MRVRVWVRVGVRTVRVRVTGSGLRYRDGGTIVVGVLAVVLVWVLACMRLGCWLAGVCRGVQGAGMLAGGIASLVVLPKDKP